MRIYFMGVCGTAMGNAALLARAAGHEVFGADRGVYPPMSGVLAAAGITVHEGYDAGRLERLAPQLVVVGNALTRGHPEVEWLLESRAMPFTSVAALLHDLVLGRRRNIVICGTHGKTTTTALTAFLLREAGRDPGFLIGGVPQDPPVGARLGNADEPFIIEGDEYDSAFFDKRSKFIHYAPGIAVLNNLEFDHADIFRDLADVQRTFTHLVRIVPANGCVVINGDDPNIAALGPMPWTRVVRVGVSEECDTRIVDFAETEDGARFSLRWRERAWADVHWRLGGIFNARNAAMAATAAGLAVSRHQVVPAGAAADPGSRAGRYAWVGETPTALRLDALSRFRGVKRRQEVLFQSPGLVVVEDFGHHPTALAETLRSLRKRFPGRRLVAAFEPRSNTARTKVLQGEFIEALALADAVYLGAVNRAEQLDPDARFDAAEVAARLGSMGRRARFFGTNAALLDALDTEILAPKQSDPSVVVLFSNGDFGGISSKFAAAAAKAAR